MALDEKKSGLKMELSLGPKRVKPAEVLLGRVGGERADRRSGAGRRLLPDGLHDVVLQRLAAQTAAAERRTVHLLEGLS